MASRDNHTCAECNGECTKGTWEEWLEMRRGTLRIYHQFPVGLIAFALGLVLGLWSAGGM